MTPKGGEIRYKYPGGGTPSVRSPVSWGRYTVGWQVGMSVRPFLVLVTNSAQSVHLKQNPPLSGTHSG